MTEFDLIKHYFSRPTQRAALSGGDDCALIDPTPGMQLVISSDMLVEGRHFFADVSPFSLGHKALAVNLSDLAACGATPVAFTLALSLPSIDPAWLQAFSNGLYALADAHGCELIGGDTTRGPLNICITVFGEVPRGKALLRILLAIPVMVIAYAMSLVLGVAVVAAWLIAVITGTMPKPLYDGLDFCIAYTMKAYAYIFLLTETYPPLSNTDPTLASQGGRDALTATPGGLEG